MKSIRRRPGKGSSSQTSGVPSSRAQAPPKVAVSPPTTVELRGVTIHFPFRPYKCQEDYMSSVLDALNNSENALLESPTGTGKTLCLLCATLAWQRQQATSRTSNSLSQSQSENVDPSSTRKGQAPTIIYASRTHSQLSQVVRELRSTRYRPKHAVLGSREQMCVHPKVKKAKATAADINHDCSRLGKERKCAFRNRLDTFQPPTEVCGSNHQAVMDMEDLVQMGTSRRVCPFYYTRSLVEDAELIFVPYNYLFDKDSRSTTLADVPWKNAIVIFDEAHNLESFASESASFDLTSSDIGGCIAEVERAMNFLAMQGGGADDGRPTIKVETALKLKAAFLELEEHIMSLNPAKTAYRGEFMMEIFSRGAKINHANHPFFLEEIRKISDIFLEYGGNQQKGAAKLEHFAQCVKRVFGEQAEGRCFAKAQSYRVHVSPKQSASSKGSMGRTISYWCFAPSEAMSELANLQIRSFLVTSGTLSPLESYALELDLPFPNRLENPHIIPQDQIHVRVIGKGVSGKVLSSSYERRQDEEYYTELGNTLVTLANIVPGGMLVFFPSYGVMETCIEKWGGPVSPKSRFQKGKPTNSFFAPKKRVHSGSSRYSFPMVHGNMYNASREVVTPWKRLLGKKAIVVEPRSTTDLPDAIAEFHKYLAMEKSKGVSLFGVCRGKISEGIDFAHNMCRAVVITGLPFAPSFDPKVKMKREFLDHARASANVKSADNAGFGSKKRIAENVSISGHEWYTQQAHRAVNQAIGRVIRNKVDYGAILLLDSRFCLPGNQKGLSKWVRPHVLSDEGFGKVLPTLVRFYREAEKKSRISERINDRKPRENKVAMILKYEENGKENEESEEVESLSKVAFIGSHVTKGGRSNSGSGEQSAHYIPSSNVIAKVDLDTVSGAYTAAKILAKSNQSASSSLKEARGTTTEESRNANAHKVLPEGRIQKATKPGHTAAQQFFAKVKTTMTTTEQSTVKKAAVAMKHSAEKDRALFRSSIKDVLKVLLRYESFEDKTLASPPEMLLLFLELLPQSTRREAQEWALLFAVHKSQLVSIMNEPMGKAELTTSCADLARVLWKAWFFKRHEADRISKFLASLDQTMLPLLQVTNYSRGMVAAVQKLIPKDYHRQTTALFDQRLATRKVVMIKAQEKEGPVSNDASVVLDKTTGEKGKRNKQSRQRTSEDLSAKESGEPRITKKSAFQSGQGDSLLTRPQKIRKNGMESAVTNSISSNESKRNPLQYALQISASRTYTGPTGNGTRGLVSNAPKVAECVLCETRSDKSFIAECGHLACSQCWQGWLKKSQSCPICRKPTSMEELALAVFQDTAATRPK